MALRAVLAVLVAGSLCACGDDGGGDPPLVPADYAATYEEVRSCRFSVEHDLTRIRIVAAPDALAPYRTRSAPFPTGAIVLKEEYDSADMTCAGPIIEFTVMQKLDAGSSPDTLDWAWQKVGVDRRVKTTDLMRCIRCHTGCGKPPEGHDGTCAMP
jgi:hypothetical protein